METLFPPESRPFRQVLHSNPFYLLSAACMLGGCLALTNSLSWVSIPLGRLLTLIATLNVYEISLLALAWYLVRRRRLLRDGATLLILESLFLADVTFLNSEISTANLGWGMAINALLLLAAAIKLAVALRLLGMQRLAGEFALLMFILAVNSAIPVFFTWIDHGSISAIWFYLMWWIAGALLGGYALLGRWMPLTANRLSMPLLAYLAVPWLSLAAHIGNLQYVYDQPFWGANLAPVLLGLTLLLSRVARTHPQPRRDLLLLRMLLPLAALLVSVNNPAPLCLPLDKLEHLILTPTRLIVVMGYLTYVYCFFSRQWMWMIPAGAAGVALNIFGPTEDQIALFLEAGWITTSNYAWRLTPKTQFQWGCIAVAASFAFLGIGAAISLRKRPSDPTNEPPPLSDPPILPVQPVAQV